MTVLQDREVLYSNCVAMFIEDSMLKSYKDNSAKIWSFLGKRVSEKGNNVLY